jgi:hypothetical protein
LAEARDHTTSMVRSLVARRNSEDWRSWVLHVRDDLGDEVFVMPFAFVLSKPHCRLVRFLSVLLRLL